jgi:hypothetical protein
LALVSSLFLGVSLGFMGGVLFTNHQFGGRGTFERRVHGQSRRGPAMGVVPSTRVLPWLQRSLTLAPAQVDSIRSEIQRSRGDLKLVHDSLHVRIARHLTPAQRERFRGLLSERFPDDHRGRRPRLIRAEPGSEGEPK